MSFAVIAGVVTTAVAGYGQYQAGQQAQEGAEYNARIQDQHARSQRDTMVENMRRKQEDKGRYMASLNVHQAASGVLSDKGTPVLMREEIGQRLTEQINDYSQQAIAAENYTRSQAAQSRFVGEQSATAAGMQAGATILGGMGKMYSSYRDGVDKGTFKPIWGRKTT